MQRPTTIIAAALLSSLMLAGPAAAQDMKHGGHGAMDKDMHGSKDEAVNMVKKGVAYIRAHGKEKGYAEITREGSPFKDRDLYLVVYALDGLVLAHGQNHKMVNKNLIGLRDIDGKAYIRETVERARTEDQFWMDHKFTSPVTRQLHPMRMYCERLGDAVICGGHFMM